MPPRYAYWTILIDQKPTAFRAREQDELLPTLAQLRRTNKDVVLRWFARGKLWDSPGQAQWAAKNVVPRETRGRDWRPGGQHKDPRARFKKGGAGKPRGDRPWQGKPSDERRPPQGARPWQNKPKGARPPGARPWHGKPTGDRRPPQGDRPWQSKPKGARPPGARPWHGKPGPKPDGGRRFSRPADHRRDRAPFRPPQPPAAEARKTTEPDKPESPKKP